MDINEIRRQSRDDNAHSAWSRGPEIIAAERRILTYADALLTWMRREVLTNDLPQKMSDRTNSFFTHERKTNPAGSPEDERYNPTTTLWILDKMDASANRLTLDLLRAAWELRCWRERYGEITLRERDDL